MERQAVEHWDAPRHPSESGKPERHVPGNRFMVTDCTDFADKGLSSITVTLPKPVLSPEDADSHGRTREVFIRGHNRCLVAMLFSAVVLVLLDIRDQAEFLPMQNHRPIASRATAH
jgi:hypothetical protein